MVIDNIPKIRLKKTKISTFSVMKVIIVEINNMSKPINNQLRNIWHPLSLKDQKNNVYPIAIIMMSAHT